MKNIFFFLFISFITFSCTQKQPVLYMVGDSTMANKPDLEYPERGWGQLLPMFFDTTITIENHAKNGRSTRSFIYEGRWDSVCNKLKPGDFVVIQFGHNDDVITKSKTYTTLQEFKYNLSKYIADARKKGAKPILCSPIIRRNFVGGILEPTHGEYPEIVKQVAENNETPFIDMTALSRNLILELGEEDSKNLYLHLPPDTYKKAPNGKIDNTHFSEEGAIAMSRLFVNAIQNEIPDLVKFLKDEK